MFFDVPFGAHPVETTFYKYSRVVRFPREFFAIIFSPEFKSGENIRIKTNFVLNRRRDYRRVSGVLFIFYLAG
jgi:hypothetical protein